MEQYCVALINQEKALEDLQRHLRTTEELFRESVKRKNQQLDLLQSEVRRLKTSVGVRDEAANLQIDAALNAQAGELRRAKEALAKRESEVDSLTKQVTQLKLDLADERARRTAEAANGDEATSAKHALQQSEAEVEGLRRDLAQAQEAAMRLQAASAEAEVALEARDAELAALRERERSYGDSGAAMELDMRELRQLRTRMEEADRTIAQEQAARSAAEAHTESLEREREELEAGKEADLADLAAENDELRRALEAGGEAAEMQMEVVRLRSQLEQMQAELAGRPADISDAPPARAPAPAMSSGPPPAPMAVSSGALEPTVRSLVLGGEAVVSATLTAQASLIDADADVSRFAWHRGTSPQPISQSPTYTCTAEDLGHEITVRVTPVAGSGEVGPPKMASTSHPIAVPGNLHASLGEWLRMGQKGFPNIADGDKERQLLFTLKNLKLRDRSGTTVCKSDGYGTSTVRLDAENPTGFTLTIGTKKGKSDSFALQAQPGVRDLIALTLQAFTDPPALSSMPVSATTGSNSLHLASVGALTTPGGGGCSPASSTTTEQQSLADVEDPRPSSAAGTSAGASSSRSSKLNFGGKKLSFARALKKK